MGTLTSRWTRSTGRAAGRRVRATSRSRSWPRRRGGAARGGADEPRVEAGVQPAGDRSRFRSVMRLSVVLSTHAASFEAVAFKGDFEANVAKIAGGGVDGGELAIRDPRLVDADELDRVVGGHGLAVPAIGTGQAWGEEKLSFTSDGASVRQAANPGNKS